MLDPLNIREDCRLTKAAQIVKAIKEKIEVGKLDKDKPLPSINRFSRQYRVSRDTVERAYKTLKKEGYIVSVIGRGYFVASRKAGDFKILLILNEPGCYQNDGRDQWLFEPAGGGNIDLKVYYNDLERFREIVSENLWSYHYYYIVLPQVRSIVNQKEIVDVLKLIPESKRLILQEREC